MRRRWTWVAWSMLGIFVVGYGVGFPWLVASDKFGQDNNPRGASP